jgi:hypothetical protein
LLFKAFSGKITGNALCGLFYVWPLILIKEFNQQSNGSKEVRTR